MKGCGSLSGWFLKILLDLSKSSRLFLMVFLMESSLGVAVGMYVRPLERRLTSASVRDLEERLVMYLSWLSMVDTLFLICVFFFSVRVIRRDSNW